VVGVVAAWLLPAAAADVTLTQRGKIFEAREVQVRCSESAGARQRGGAQARERFVAMLVQRVRRRGVRADAAVQ